MPYLCLVVGVILVVDTAGPQWEQAALHHPQIVKSVATGRSLDKDDPFSPRPNPDRFASNRGTAYRGLTGERRPVRSAFPVSADPARENYPHAPGQMVMGATDLSETHELDHHGNAFDEDLGHLHSKVGPQFTNLAEHIWATKGVSRNVRADSVIHTGQPAESTDHGRYGEEKHRYITGPLDQSKPIADVAHVEGMPFLADGHHRLAEARGRAEDSVHVRTLDVDKVRAEATRMPKITSRNPTALEQHLLGAHMHDHASVAHGGHEPMHEALHRRTLTDHFHAPAPDTR